MRPRLRLEPKELEVLEAALATWGPEPQVRQLQEEAAELIAAINHLAREREGALGEVVEEVADLLLCLGQLFLMFKAARLEAEVDGVMRRRARRLAERIHKAVRSRG